MLRSLVGSEMCIRDSLNKLHCRKPLIVTDKVIIQHGLLDTCLSSLKESAMAHSVFDGVLPDPPIKCVEEGYAIYQKEGCDSLVAFGGGSVMDTAKMIGAKIANPKPLPEYEGILTINMAGLRPLPPFIAVPTTAGTGSEVSIGAVITNEADNSKMVCIDLGIVPQIAVLDPELIFKLPKSITAATGLDALTHAIEAYMNGICTSRGSTNAVSATTKVFNNLVRTYHDGNDAEARQEMLRAAFEAGVAITNGHVGYVHAIAHQLGALCHTPHGFACAMVLPHVLEFYIRNDQKLERRLSEFAIAAQVVSACRSGTQDTAELFVEKIRGLCQELGAPTTVVLPPGKFDVKEVTARAMAEAHGSKHPIFTVKHILDTGYPVPAYMSYAQCEEIVRKVLPPGNYK
eukprot:TRINITY_DN21017_c0_g1_i1.p1 TRINITY_DN21017_c0_g1~~TRINITY_DN21017_c0_g1_i1.p1  ORF type:complete len:454 (-),score=113.98 TRINITY_DN21017_c0_g1_i1:219-1424(-)